MSSGSATVTVADILELRADGLTEEEIWSLLCQAVQTLQDLFLSDKITGGKVVPLVSPNTLGISRKGTAVITFISRTHSNEESYLAPEYAERERCLDALDWEKMWVYSLGKTLLSALKATARVESLTVLRFMTAKDPTVRASLMSLLNGHLHFSHFCTSPSLFTGSEWLFKEPWMKYLVQTHFKKVYNRRCKPGRTVKERRKFLRPDLPLGRYTDDDEGFSIISEHCKTSPPTKPSSHLVMEMYKEVFGSPTQCLLPSSDVVDPSSFQTEIPRSTICNSEPPRVGQKAFSSDNSSNGILEPCPQPKRNPVHRAPSRLYRGPEPKSGNKGREDRLLPSTCVGPEFVVRGMEPAKVIHIGDTKVSQRKALTVILLTGQRLRVTCDPQKITCGKLFEVLVQVENIEDNYIFGLASTINGDFVFIPSEMKLRRVAPSGWKDGGKEPHSPSFFLYVRVKFFLPSLWRLRNSETKHLMYLQLRRSLLEQQIKCELEELLVLGGLALQAEFGNFDENEHGASPYFLLEHYIPEELIDERFRLEARLQEHHRSRSGLDPSLAEEIFVAQVQRLPEYGSHHYTASWVRKSVSIPMWVTVNPQGVYLYEKRKNVLDRKIHEAFAWKNIQGLSCNENYFRLVPQDVFGQRLTCYKLRMDKKKSFFLFRLASFHHRFFLKLRIELSPLHALSQEFGVTCKKDSKNIFYVEKKSSRTGQCNAGTETYLQKNGKKVRDSLEDIEERQNKENENPVERRPEKRRGVKMGVSAFHPGAPGSSDACRRFSLSETSSHSLDAYVIDSSIRSSEERFTYDLHESIPSKLADKWNDVSWEEERFLRTVRLKKDKYGSFGLEIVEGSNGGLFVESVLKRKGEDEIDSVRKGDQLVSANGICLLNLNYAEALNILKNTGNEIEILVSQRCKGESLQKPVEHEYLRNIRLAASSTSGRKRWKGLW